MNAIHVKSWETKNLLLNYISRNSPSVVVGSDTEGPRGFYSCVVEGRDCQIHIGVIANQPKSPCTIFFPVSKQVILGYDQSIAVIDCPSSTLRRSTLLDGVFFEFLRDEERAQTIVVHELGVVAISEMGDELWRYTASEILEGWRRVDGCLILTLMDSNTTIELNLVGGAQMNPHYSP
jgi:hypothetical protein